MNFQELFLNDIGATLAWWPFSKNIDCSHHIGLKFILLSKILKNLEFSIIGTVDFALRPIDWFQDSSLFGREIQESIPSFIRLAANEASLISYTSQK
jgi:hypothetical protein